MITWHLFIEQFFNEKLIVQVLEVGVTVGSEVVIHLGEEEKFGIGMMVQRENVEEATDMVMDEGEEKEKRKEQECLQRWQKRKLKRGIFLPQHYTTS